jgi:hypothetical protein
MPVELTCEQEHEVGDVTSGELHSFKKLLEVHCRGATAATGKGTRKRVHDKPTIREASSALPKSTNSLLLYSRTPGRLGAPSSGFKFGRLWYVLNVDLLEGCVKLQDVLPGHCVPGTVQTSWKQFVDTLATPHACAAVHSEGELRTHA